ncbi:kinase-like domain-containing protein [Aspergillus karnatakaensis]|uniref:kinase-like domain-containing protein n=1 Tax=Aspergillus karnatakaensis TaxID=1810916 RepID=UPI003CCD9762
MPLTSISSTRRYLMFRPAYDSPRKLPSAGFPVIQTDRPVEEEELPDYRPDRFYPVQLGETFQGRYEVLTKLGFGTSSTTWLARDLQGYQYVALKVYVHTSLVHRELPFYHHIRPRLERTSADHRVNIRRLFDSFQTAGPHGKHHVLAFEPAQMSLRDMKSVFRPGGFDEDFVRGAIFELLKALDFLHTHGETVHTDPSGRTIYLSRLMRPTVGPMLLSDFGEARIGPGPHGGDIMPLEYRAPETLLYELSGAWDLLQPKKLFTARDEDGDLYDAALGPPPAEFLAGNPQRRADFCSDNGEWLGLAPIPYARTMEAETRLEDKSAFLGFIRRTLTWLPEDRPTAHELLQDPWLRGGKV